MKNKSQPLYMRLRNQLVKDIKKGKLKSNQRLPSERQLSEQFQVSRMTARHALKQLESEGLAYTVNGRKSRFVSLPTMEYDLSKTISFFASSTYGKKELAIVVLDKKTTTGTDEQCARLDIPKGENIHHYSRLCKLDDKPAFIEQEYVSARLFPGLWEHDIAQPVFQLFDRAYGIRSVRDQIIIRQSKFPKDIAKSLNLKVSTPGIVLEQSVFDIHNQQISFATQYWRGDMARFSVDISY